MDRLPLSSRAVLSAGYDEKTRTLELEFSSGRVYRYADVPASVYDWLLRVPNKGIYVTSSINGRYAYEDVTHPAAEPADLAALLEASLVPSADG